MGSDTAVILLCLYVSSCLSYRSPHQPPEAGEEIKFHKHHDCDTGEFPCATSSKCLAQRYWCDEIKDCPEGDDEDPRYCGEKTSGFGRTFIRRIQDSDLKTDEDCLGSEPLLPEGTFFHNHVGKEGVKCFVQRFPKRCQCLVNRIRCDNLSLTSVFPFNDEITDPNIPVYSFASNRLQFIQEDVLSMFPNLRNLDFRRNSISGINARAFNNLSQLRRLHLDNNKIGTLDPKVFWPLRNLCFLWLGQNLIQSWEPYSFNNSKLRWLDLKANRISLEPGMFSSLGSLYYLELERNEIKNITKDRLNGLSSLIFLDLSSNLIENIDEDAFEATPLVEELSLAENQLTSLPTQLFTPLYNLLFLNLSTNSKLVTLPMDIFKGLTKLDRLNLSGVSINNIHREMFDDIPNNALMYRNNFERDTGCSPNHAVSSIFSKFHYCYYAAHIVDCYPKSDGISSSENLIDLTAPRIIIWVLIALIPLTNLCVLVARCCIAANEPVVATGVPQRFHRHEVDVMNKLRYNLFVANLLMAVYLLIIAVYDIEYRENYHREAYEWLHGFACQAAGMLASLSICISLITICCIVADRCVCITQPPANHLTGRGAVWLLVNLWIGGLMMFGIPVAVWDNVTGSFYGNNGLCIPLYLDEPYLNGWWYSALLFFGIFFVCVGVTAYCGMKTRLYLAKHKNSKERMEEVAADLYYLRRYYIIVVVNLVCWIPVIVVKLIAFTSFEVGNHVHSVYAVLILPLNSFLTPVLHVQLFAEFRRKSIKAVSLLVQGRGRCFREREESESEMKFPYHQSSLDNAMLHRRHPSPGRPHLSTRPTPSPEHADPEATERTRFLQIPDAGRPRSFSTHL